MKILRTKLYDVWKRSNISNQMFRQRGIQDTYEILENHLRIGDILFFFWGKDAKRYDKLLMFFSQLPIVHIGFVRKQKEWMLLHSTMKTYSTGSNGVHEISLKQEILHRWPKTVVLVTRLKGKNTDFKNIFHKVHQMKTEKIKYSFIDAFCSLFQVGTHLDHHYNCWDFVNECFKNSPHYTYIKNSGVPCNILQKNNLDWVYITEI